MRSLIVSCLALIASGLVASTAAAEDPAELPGSSFGAGRDENVAVQWAPYDDPEPAWVDPSLDSGRQISQEFAGPATMTGLTWSSGTPSAVWLQSQISGVWGEWELLDVDADHGSDDDVQRGGTQPTVIDEPDAFRFVIEGTVDGAEVFVFAPADPLMTRAAPRRPSTPIEPEDFEPMWPGASFVRDRTEWDSAGCRLPEATFDFSASTAVVIHHTAGTNNYSQSQVPAILAGLCSYQVNARELDDIGYNFLVDRFGTVWEGRTGSKRAPIISAHTRGFNYVTQGVALLGDFTSTQPSSAQRSGLQSIVNWLTGWHGIDPDANVTLVAGSDGTGFSEGDTRVVQGVTGHRELGQTACPGASFYPAVRTIAANTRPTNFGNDDRRPLCRGNRLTYIGSPGDDVIDGTARDDVILALDGNDTVYGHGGDDLICGDAGNDKLFGSAGTDTLFGDEGNDILKGGTDSDRLNGDSGNDRVFGEAGNDTLYGSRDNDVVNGGSGNDRVYGGLGNDTLYGSRDNDTIYGENGDDIIKAGQGNDRANGGSGNDRVFGEAGIDTLYGSRDNDIVNGHSGNDRVYGGLGDDSLYGSRNNDSVYGENGDDYIMAGLGDDHANGGNGDDRVYGEAGNDTLYGSRDNDTLGGGDGTDVLNGGLGTDSCSFSPVSTVLNCETLSAILNI